MTVLNPGITDYDAFLSQVKVSKIDICKELYQKNKATIRIKTEKVAVRNLVRIIDSTLKLANSKGFHGMSLRDLCADSGLSMGGLYAYIKNKDDLIHLIQSHGFILTRRTLIHFIEHERDAHQKLYVAVKAHLFLSEWMRAWFYFSFMEVKNLPDSEKKDAIAIEQEIDDIFQGILIEGIQSGTFRAVEPRVLSGMIKALLQDWYLKRSKHRQHSLSVEHYAETVTEVLECYLRKS